MATITSKGVETSARMIANISPAAAFTYLATGSGSTAESASSTALAAENTQYGGERAAADCAFTAPGTVSWSKLFSFSGTVIIREIGVFNAAAAGDMFLRVLLNSNKTYEEGMSALITITTAVASV
jgi:hypothetical protein